MTMRPIRRSFVLSGLIKSRGYYGNILLRSEDLPVGDAELHYSNSQ